MWLPLVGLALGIALGLVLNFTVSPDLARYSAVAILAGLDSVLGAVRAELGREPLAPAMLPITLGTSSAKTRG